MGINWTFVLWLFFLAGCGASSPLKPLLMSGPELHASLSAPKVEDLKTLRISREVHRDNPYISSDPTFVEAIARGGSQGRLDGAGFKAALYALYRGEGEELGLYGLEAKSTADADRREGEARKIWAYNERLGRARVHREGKVIVVVWHSGLSPSVWEAANNRIVERLKGR